MDKRFFIALLLTSLVVIATPLLFPTPPRVTPKDRPVGDTAQGIGRTTRDTLTLVAESLSILGKETAPAPLPVPSVVEGSMMVDTTEIKGMNADFLFSNKGAQLVSATLRQFRSYRAGKNLIALRGESDPLLSYHLVDAAGNRIELNDVIFEKTTGPNSPANVLTYRAPMRLGTIALTYAVVPDSYMVRVTGRIEGQTERATLFVSLPGGLRSEEADTLDDRQHLAFSVKARREDARRIQFDDLDPGESDTTTGAISWAASKNKYFLTALLAPTDKDAFSGAIVTGGARTAKVATRVDIDVARAVIPGESFVFDVYAGPLEWKRLHALGRDFENVNPYGGFMQPLIQPFATIVMRVLLWMRETFKISYGWVLVVFGLLVRIVTWPLNQSAMKTSLRMQRIQPQLTAVQQKYKSNPDKQREEIMQVYREHGMTPFSPLMGCLPMLLPMPVLFALFFVFQNTIEFRGVPFLWLPDISLHDPLYIIPVVMGISMYALSWIGMRNAPPNPQAKMMGYILPVMMTVLFWRFASGLNLYYTVQNIAALPQQWLIARDRGKTAPAATPVAVSRR